MAFRLLRVLARDVARAGRGGCRGLPLHNRILPSQKQTLHISFSLLNNSLSSPWPVRGAANNALNIVRYLEGIDDENDDPLQLVSPDADEPVEDLGSPTSTDEEVADDVEAELSELEYDSEQDEEIFEEKSSDGEEMGRDSDLEGWETAARLKLHADGMYRNVIDTIAHPDALSLAFDNIKKKYGKLIFRSQESIDWRWCVETADALRSGTYAFHPVRHINVPVLGQSEKMRSIRVVSPKDQIILEASRAALDKIYSPLASPYVHSSKHTALEQVKYTWRGTSWFLEFAINKSYDETNKKRLKNILSENIQDKRFLDTLFQMWNAGVVGLEKSHIEEGGILSSLLRNIYYQKLDEEIEAIKKEWNSGVKKQNVDMVLDKKTLARIGGDPEQMRLEKQRRLKLSRKHHNDPDFTRVQYVRFGDEFLLGLVGSKGTALRIMKRLTTFLQSNLQLQLDSEKTRLGHAVSDKTLFLGAYIRVQDPKEFREVSSSLTRAIARKREQTMRVKEKLEDRWTRECRNVVLKCWTRAYEKWRRELGKDGAKKRTFEAATRQLMSLPDEESSLWREKAQNVLHVFISAALRQGMFPPDEVESYYQVLDSLERSLSKVPVPDSEDDLDL